MPKSSSSLGAKAAAVARVLLTNRINYLGGKKMAAIVKIGTPEQDT